MQGLTADMKSLGITHVWFPPSTDAAVNSSTGNAEGYLPRQLNILTSAYGSQTELQSAISAFTAQGIRSVADVVINHRVGTSSTYGAVTNPNWGFSSVVSNDEGGDGTGAPDTGLGFPLAPDLDYTNTTTANGIISYMAVPKSLGFTGLRYDYAARYRGGLEESYTNQFSPDLCVPEVWTSSRTSAMQP